MKLSEAKPWIKYYPQEILDMQVPQTSLNQYFKEISEKTDENECVIKYYGRNITWKNVWENVNKLTNALYTAGVKKGDQIPAFLQSVPEFIYLLFAAERLGASILCRDGTMDENVEAVKKSNAKIVIVHDFHPEAEIQEFNKLGIERLIYLNPYVNTVGMPEYVVENLLSYYETDSTWQLTETNEDYQFQKESWTNFINSSTLENIKYEENIDINSPLLRAYTTGTTGTAKQVIHSAQTIIGVISQMNWYAAPTDMKFTWMHGILPPSLVAVTVSMILSPLASGKQIVLTPFINVKDFDLALVEYKPNGFAMIPMYLNVLLNSKLLKNEDLSYIIATGIGAEFVNNKQLKEISDFFKSKNSRCQITTGYGLSEAGSNCTFFTPDIQVGNFCYGIPMPLTTISIFKKDTDIELAPNTIGEICISGPGVMVGYDNEESTNKTIKVHRDGKRWLHSGDIGYMNELGHLYCFSRGYQQDANRNNLFVSCLENKIIFIEGIKDAFFINIEDKNNKGVFSPYLYVIKDKNSSEDDIKEAILKSLEEYEYPKEIIFIKERPYYHFKTARKILEKEIKEKNNL